ncbi:DeoR/GlpR family DNA-binding transcription regulator [Carnimonas bestiolae]|uniref:DeoR/GlpR family DNA-binding transcription regulator n=1 Tax=Carnimonas bestiolae TaxID=3402172 RepID=UPI003EDB9529
MKAFERQEEILKAVSLGTTEVEVLAKIFNVSIATIRRDIRSLVEGKRLLKTYGGVALLRNEYGEEESLELRQSRYLDAKGAIAAKAFSEIRPGDTIFLDAGTTVAALAELIYSRNDVKVVTNNLLIANQLALSGVDTTIIGGGVRAASLGLYGSLAELALDKINIDRAFVSGDALDVNRGLFEGCWAQAQFREKLFRSARTTYILACADKFSSSGRHWVPLPRGSQIITDSMPDVHIDEKELERRGITFCVAPPLE